MPQFDFTTFSSQIFWLAICFTILYIFISKVILPRIAEIKKIRQETIDQDQISAQDLEAKINKLEEKTNLVKKNANEKYQSQIDATLQEAKEEKEKQLNELKDQIDEMNSKSNQEIKSFLENSYKENDSTIKDLVQKIKEKLLLA